MDVIVVPVLWLTIIFGQLMCEAWRVVVVVMLLMLVILVMVVVMMVMVVPVLWLTIICGQLTCEAWRVVSSLDLQQFSPLCDLALCEQQWSPLIV
jgi:hypothetical protein